MIEIGKTYTQEMTVGFKDTAISYGSGNLEVFATPAMIAFMENTAIRCLEDVLEPEMDSVGIEITAQHIKATAVSQIVGCTAVISEVEGRRISFNIKAWDEKGMIGQAIHRRFVIDPIKFMTKL